LKKRRKIAGYVPQLGYNTSRRHRFRLDYERRLKREAELKAEDARQKEIRREHGC